MALLLVLGGALLGAVVLLWLGAFSILYHLIRFGIGTLPKRIAFIFFVGFLLLFFVLIFWLFMSFPAIQFILNSFRTT